MFPMLLVWRRYLVTAKSADSADLHGCSGCVEI